MKKLITAAALLFSAFTFAQKEGSVTYAMTMEGIPAEQAAMMGDMETKVYYKEGKSYIEATSMMYSYKILNDDKGMLMLMDMMGNKYYTRQTKEEMEKNAADSKNKDPKFEYTEETKTVAGYECKKAICTLTGKEGEFKTDVWYTEKIPYIAQGGGKRGAEMFKGIKGMPLEYTMKQGPATIKMSAKEVSLDKVPDSIFTLSTEGYTEKKMDDMKKGGQ